MSAITLIAVTNHFRLRPGDLLSTLYTCEDAIATDSSPSSSSPSAAASSAASADSSLDYQVYRHVRRLYTSMMPLSLKCLCRNEIRSQLFAAAAATTSTSVPTPHLDDPSAATVAELALVERVVQAAFDYATEAASTDEQTRRSLVNFLALAEFDDVK